MIDSDVIVIGAGPVGMLASLMASRRGLHVVLLEQAPSRHAQSRAVGIMPPSLEILRAAGLDQIFIAQGVPVRVVEAHGRSRRLSRLDLSGLRDDYPFALSLPQDRTEAILEAAVLADPTIRYQRGHRVTACSEDQNGVTVSGIGVSGGFSFSSRYALACDGGRSTVRRALGIPFDGGADPATFVMGDFADQTGWGPQARFFFTPRGSVESFPLPELKRRYVLRTPRYVEESATDYFRMELRWRTGIDTDGVGQFWKSSFRVERYLARSFCSGRVFLCGDAAHLMSPVGGQNMNTGFADAELAAWLVGLLAEERVSPVRASELYHRVRRRSAGAASRRAHIMMRAGTSGGRLWSPIRNAAACAIMNSLPQRALIRRLSMRNIPFRNLAHFRSRFERELFSGFPTEAS